MFPPKPDGWNIECSHASLEFRQRRAGLYVANTNDWPWYYEIRRFGSKWKLCRRDYSDDLVDNLVSMCKTIDEAKKLGQRAALGEIEGTPERTYRDTGSKPPSDYTY